MCDELGNQSHMNNYITSAGKTSLCSIITGKGCSEKESKFIANWKVKSSTVIEKEYERLNTMQSTSKLTATASDWISRRIGVLAQMMKETTTPEL